MHDAHQSVNRMNYDQMNNEWTDWYRERKMASVSVSVRNISLQRHVWKVALLARFPQYGMHTFGIQFMISFSRVQYRNI